MEIEMLGDSASKPKTVFKDKKNKEIHIYFFYNIIGAEEYLLEIEALRKAKKDETVFIHFATDGGYLDTTIALVNEIRSCKAKTVANINFACSAGTIIALACDYLTMAKNGFFMIHNYSDTSSGKGGELKTKKVFMDTWVQNFFRDVYFGFLTDAEIDKVFDDKDFWFSQEETMLRVEKLNRKYIE